MSHCIRFTLNTSCATYTKFFQETNKTGTRSYLCSFCYLWNHTAIYETSTYIPYQMLFGRELCQLHRLLFGRHRDNSSSPKKYLRNFQAWFEGKQVCLGADPYNKRKTQIRHEGNWIWTIEIMHVYGIMFSLRDFLWNCNEIETARIHPSKDWMTSSGE